MKMPTWVTLKLVSNELVSSACNNVQSLRPLLGQNRNNKFGID
uniref:Uncharacterized protein n=1 Tax=Physcomitrium patens TaxID=3218 RepID=A0A2K1KCR0_PHYPA|nr:hypothetical protein PHYPA_010745 [Physcomitrium patens]